MNRFTKALKTDLPMLMNTPEVLLRLKGRFLLSFLRLFSALGAFLVVLAAALLIPRGETMTLGLALFVYLAVLLATIFEKWSYSLRGSIILGAVFISGLLLLLENGPNAGAQLVFLLLVFLTLVLFGFWTTVLVAAGSVAIFMALGEALSSGLTLPWVAAPPAMMWNNWLDAGLVFLLMMLVLIAVFMLIFLNLQQNIGPKLNEARELEQERMGLEWQVRERTVTLQNEIVERRKIEEALRESETNFRSLLSQLPVGVYRTTLDGKILQANPALANMLGFERVEDLITNGNMATFYDQPEERNIFLEKLRQDKGVFVFEVRLKGREGAEVWVKNTGRAIMDPSEQVLYIDGTIEDITEQKKAREALNLTEQRLALYIKKSFLAFIEWNLNFEVMAWNPAAESIFGYSVQDVMGKRAIDLIFSGEEQNPFLTNWKQMISQQDVKHNIYENQRKDGRKIACEWFTTPLVNAEGQIIGVVSQVMDISERVQAEKLEKALYRIAETANNSDNLLELYKAVHAIISDLIPANNFFIALYDAVDETLEFPYYVDEYDTTPIGRFKLGNGLTDYVIRTGKPLLAYPQEKQKLKEIGNVIPVGTDSMDWVGVPLITAANRVMGALVVQTYTRGQRYSLTDIDILSFVSTQIAMAIERKQSEERLKYLSTHDVLTGLFNRNFFETEIERLQNSRFFPISILVADVDNLKQINDRLGHVAGDNLLKQVAHLFRDAFRSEDIISRIGGDEFAVLLPYTGENVAFEITTRLRKMMVEGSEEHYPSPLYISIGISTATNESRLLDILKDADDRMYIEKKGKKKRGTGQLV